VVDEAPAGISLLRSAGAYQMFPAVAAEANRPRLASFPPARPDFSPHPCAIAWRDQQILRVISRQTRAGHRTDSNSLSG